MTQTLALANAFDAFIKGCKTDGTWGAIKASCILAGWNNPDGALTPLVGAAPTNFNFWGNADPSWASVSLLLRMNGANASTTFSDSSSNAFAVSRFGNAQISTAQSKFGGASGLFDGTGDYLTVPDTTANNLPGDFTIETWIYLTGYSASFAGAYGALLTGNYRGIIGAVDQGWQLRVNGTVSSYDTINVYTGRTDLNFAAGTLALNTWHHIAVSRSGSSIRAFANGTQAGSTVTNTDAFTHDNLGARLLRVGELDDATYKFGVKGYIDDLRITKGVARYTSNFTPPTQTFPGATADYNRETGLVGDGSTKYLNTNSSPTAAPETLTNFAYAVYCSQLPTNGIDSAFIGCRGNTGNDLYQLNRDPSNQLNSYNKVTFPLARSQTTGFIGSARSGTAESLRSGGASTTATSTAIGSFSSQTNVGVYSFREVNGNRVNLSNARISFYMQAGFLDLALLGTRVTTLVNAIAAAIP